MPNTNEQILKGVIDTGSVTHGLLNPEQDRKFIRQTFEATNLRPLVRHVMRTAKTGEIDKIGIASRILRAKTEGTDDGYRGNPVFAQIQYATKAVRIPWEITEETLRENIEGQNLEAIITELMAGQVGRDLEDLDLNGDENISPSATDYDFLKVNTGWIKQIETGGHVVDRTGIDSGAMNIDAFYAGVKAMPNKYNNGKLRWVMSPHRRQEWYKYIVSQKLTVVGDVSDNRVENPSAIPVVEVATMPDDKILLTDPKNLIEVTTYGTRIRKSTEGKEAIMQDKRFYVIHLDFDAVIEELDATVIIKGLASIS